MAKKIILNLLIWGGLLTACTQAEDRFPGIEFKLDLQANEAINFIQRSGSPYQKGKQYGERLKEDIRGQMAIWKRLCKEETGLSQKELYSLLSEKTGFLTSVHQYAPELLEEIRGIAEGADVDVNDVLCLNLAEETMVYFSRGYESCTNIGLETTEENVIAYNLDLPDFLRKFKPVVLQDDNQFSYAFPGLIAAGGMNANFAVTTNSLPQLKMDLNGLPLPFMVRKLLQFSTESEAIEFLKSTPFGAPQNLMIVGRENARDFECSANQISRYKNLNNSNVVYHTNHPLINTELNDATDQKDPECERFSYLDSLFASRASMDEVDGETLKAAINNTTSNIRYDGNYFSFLGKYPKDPSLPPHFEVYVPVSSQIESASGLEINALELDEFIENQMEQHSIPGLSFALINKGKLVYNRSYGIQNLNNQKPVTNETIFEAASVSKSVFAYFTMIMVEQSVISLDTPLYKYMPEPLIPSDDRYKLITARMVLTHTSGLPNWRFFNEDGNLDIKFEPGTKFSYSGEGYEYLARVLAFVNNTDYQGLEKIIQQHVNLPLGMTSSGFMLVDELLKTKKADGYEDGEVSDGIPADMTKPYFGASFKFHTTSTDFSKFVIALIKDEGLKKKTFDEMFSEQVLLPEDESLRTEDGFESWGLGFIRAKSPYGLKLAHGGMNPSFQCYFMVLKEKQFGFVFFGNSNTSIEILPELEEYLLTGIRSF